MTPDDLDALFAKRHSCRAYKPDAVPDATVEAITATARRSPSWCNAQPWQLIVTRAKETDTFREALMAEVTSGAPKPDLPFPSGYSGIYQDRRRTCGWQLYEAVGVEKGDRVGSAKQTMKNFELFGAPHVAIVTSPVELGPYGALDCGGFVTAFCIAAQAHGVDTIPQAAVASYGPFLHRYFDIPEDRMVLCAISFGYGDPDHPANSFRTGRAEVGDILAWKG